MSKIETTVSQAQISNKDVRVVKFNGQLDETNVDNEVKKIYEIFTSIEANPYVIFDLSDLTFLNSKSIGYLTDWYNIAEEKNGKIFIAQPRENVLDIIKVVGLTNIIEVYLSVEEAKLAIMSL